MGMQALMDVRCKNLVNPVCDWLGEIYDTASREFVIPGCGRLLLDEEFVFCTLGVPRGEIKVPYEVNNKIEETLFARLFPGMASMPNTTVLAISLEGMKTHVEVFKMKLLMYLISAVFAPNTSLRPSNKCFPILVKLKDVNNMNWCTFIADFLHDAFSNKMYQKGCRLHLMLMYVDRLDLSTVDFTGIGGTPPPHKFAVSAWTYDAVKAVLAADKITDKKYGKLQLMAKHAIDYSVFGGPQNFGKWMDMHSAPSCPAEARAPVEHLIGQFASRMTGLLGKLVEGWTSLNGSDSDAVARQFTPFVAEQTHRPTGCRGRYDYNSSQELPDTQDELDGDASLDKDDDDDMENVQHDTYDDEHVEVRAGGKKGKASPDVPHRRKSKNRPLRETRGCRPQRGGGLQRMVKKTTTRVTKQNPRDPLERIHSKLLTGGNSESHEARVDKAAAAPSIVPTSSDASGRPSPPVADVQATTTGIRTSGSDESISARTAEILPTLLAMKDAAVSHATRSASVEVDAPEINLSKEDSCSSDTDSKRVGGGTSASTKEGAEATVQIDMPSTGESLGTTAPASGVPKVAKVTVSRAGLPPRRSSPRKQSADIPNAPAVARSSRDDSGYVSVSTLFPPPAKSNVMEKTEDRSTTDPGGKSGTTDRGERPEQTASLPAVENPNLNLCTSKLPVNIGVPYSPNKKIGKKVATDTADHMPRPTNKADDSAVDEAEMFVDLSPLDSAQQVVRGPASRQERHPMAFTPLSFSLGIDRTQDEPVVQDPVPVAFAFPAGIAPMMAQPMDEGRKAVKFAEPIEITPSLDEAYRRIEEAALQRRSSRGQGQSSSNVPAESVSEDTVRSATPGSVRQHRVVHAPPADDYEPEVKATKDQNQLYDIVKQFGNARSNSKHMKELKASCLDRTKIIQRDATYVDLGDLAESYSVTCKIWDGDFHHKILRKHFAAHGDFKLTMKKCVLFPMFQELAPQDPHDKCGHHYAICLDLKNQRFEVLDSMRSEADADLTTHTEYFINNLKETWNRHYENSKVQIRHFPIEYMATTKQGNR
ncbi:hypothetical protein VPH35_095668 [Triticum aestivum]